MWVAAAENRLIKWAIGSAFDGGTDTCEVTVARMNDNWDIANWGSVTGFSSSAYLFYHASVAIRSINYGGQAGAFRIQSCPRIFGLTTIAPHEADCWLRFTSTRRVVANYVSTDNALYSDVDELGADENQWLLWDSLVEDTVQNRSAALIGNVESIPTGVSCPWDPTGIRMGSESSESIWLLKWAFTHVNAL